MLKYSKYQNLLFIDSDVIIKNTLKNFSELISNYDVLVGIYDDTVTPGVYLVILKVFITIQFSTKNWLNMKYLMQQ